MYFLVLCAYREYHYEETTIGKPIVESNESYCGALRVEHVVCSRFMRHRRFVISN